MSEICILALDLSEPLQDRIASVIDELNVYELIGPCLIVDISGRGESWDSFWPGDTERKPMLDCLGRRFFDRIEVVSVRGELNDLDELRGRVEIEESLLRTVMRAYAGGDTATRGITVSLLGRQIHERMFPQDYVANFIHERHAGIDRRLPRVSLNEANSSSALAFIALSVSGAGVWMSDEAKDVLRSVDDNRATLQRFVRLVKGGVRLAVSEPVVENAMRAAIMPGGGAIPADLPRVTPKHHDPNLVRRISEQFIAKHRFRAEAFVMARPEVQRVPWLRALRDLVKSLPKYLKEATRDEIDARMSDFTEPWKEKLSKVAFGSGGVFVVDGVSVEAKSDTWRLIAEELKARLRDVGNVVSPSPSPEVWRDLLTTSFSMLDGGEFPTDIDEPTDGNRVLFLDPRVVGPPVDHDRFELSIAECELLGMDTKWARPFSVLDAKEGSELVALVRNGLSGAEFKMRVEEEAAKRESEALHASKAETRLKGQLLSRDEKLAESRRSRGIGADLIATRTTRTIEELKVQIDSWEAARAAVTSDSLMFNLVTALDSAVQAEVEGLRPNEMMEELDQAVASLEQIGKRGRSRKIARWLLILLAPLMVVAFLLSGVFAIITSVVGVPLVLFVFISWFTSFGFAMSKSIISRALANRRWDLNKDNVNARLNFSYEQFIHRSNEFRRLQLLRMQMSDWQCLIRRIVHKPYGQLGGDTAGFEVLPRDSSPPQLVMSHVAQSGEQIASFRELVHERLKIRGYLAEIERRLRDQWRTRYEEARVPDQTPPDSDVSEPDVTPGLNYLGRDYLFPRRDYVDQVLAGVFDEELLSDHLDSIVDVLKSKGVYDIYHRVGMTAGPFAEISPLDFLKEQSEELPGFDTDAFDAGRGGDLFVGNVATEYSYVTPSRSDMGNYLLQRNGKRVLLGSVKMVTSVAIRPVQFACAVDSNDDRMAPPDAGIDDDGKDFRRRLD